MIVCINHLLILLCVLDVANLMKTNPDSKSGEISTTQDLSQTTTTQSKWQVFTSNYPTSTTSTKSTIHVARSTSNYPTLTTCKCACPACATSSMTSTHSITRTIRTTPTTASLLTTSDKNTGKTGRRTTSSTFEISLEDALTKVQTFVKHTMQYLEEKGSMLKNALIEYSPVEGTELCIVLKTTDPNYRIKLRGCVNIKQPDVILLSYSDIESDPCSQLYFQNILDRIREFFSDSSEFILSKPTKCYCPSSVTSSTKPTQPTTQTTKTASLSTSTYSVSVEPNSDKIQGACTETQGIRHETVVIIGVSSFLAGVLVVLLFLCLLRLKRASQLCFRKSVKPQEPMTSERATKKVLAKHMLSDRTDPPTQTNVLYFKNESEKKDLAPNTPEDEYAEIDNPNTRQDNYTGLNNPEVKPPVNDTLSTEEHVYIGLEFDDKTTDNKHPAGESDKTADVLRETAKTGSELFDRTRDSNISGHDYFVLQNENFRNSHQPDTRVSDNMNRINDGKNERSENTYFELEKSPENTYFELEKNPENTYFQLEKGPDM